MAVHAINKTPSTFTIDIGREVGHANMAADVSRSAVVELEVENHSQMSPVVEEYTEEEPPISPLLLWEEYA